MVSGLANTKRYLVATVKPWNVETFYRRIASLPGEWRLITAKDELSLELIRTWRPRYVFFPHWSWKVPPALLAAAECVCFHMSDVPYGRGGSPLQNLIQRGHRSTSLTALRMVEELDAGPIYAKRPLVLDGRAQEIFERAADLTWDLIEDIISEEPEPQPQHGEVVTFTRRTPAMSELPKDGTLEQLYDHIRMLDADTYPRAFVSHGAFSLVLERATIEEGGLVARAVIKRATEKPE